MDNFYTQSPVLVLAQSMFEGTDAVVRADAVEDGMERMVKSELPWSEDRRTLARKLTCWYTRMSLSTEKTAEENVGVLQAHLNATRDLREKRPGLSL